MNQILSQENVLPLIKCFDTKSFSLYFAGLVCAVNGLTPGNFSNRNWLFSLTLKRCQCQL